MTTLLLPTRAATARMGETLGARLLPGDVLGLVGDLGAGKTTLAQAIARGMGIHTDVTSPTFALVHEYAGPTPLFHFDPYRLDRLEDLADLGFDDYPQRGGVIIVEWADKVADLLPPERLTIRLEIADEREISSSDEDFPRLLHVEGVGERYEALAHGLIDPLNDCEAVPIDDVTALPGGQASCGREVPMHSDASVGE